MPESVEWEEREHIAMPRASFDELEIHTADGASLRALVDDPAEDGQELRGTLVLAHAMFARKTSFGRRDRPGLSSALVAKGFRTVAFDFRGHGDSKAPTSSPEWGYDDLVASDLPAVVDCVRARGEDKPVIVVGHSLGGHAAFAAQGSGLIDADAIVGLGANVWLREFEPSRARWLAKIGIARAILEVSARSKGLLSVWARRLRIGSDDASDKYLRDLFSVVTDNQWRARDARDAKDGGRDYLANLANVKVPVAAVVGDRDRIMCHPASGEAFARKCRNAAEVKIFHATDASHMGLVKKPSAWSTIVDAIEWALSRTGACSPLAR